VKTKIIVKTKHAGIQVESETDEDLSGPRYIEFLVRKVKSLTKESKAKTKPKSEIKNGS